MGEVFKRIGAQRRTPEALAAASRSDELRESPPPPTSQLKSLTPRERVAQRRAVEIVEHQLSAHVGCPSGGTPTH